LADTSLHATCDLCGAADGLTAYAVAPQDDTVTLCPVCAAGVADGPDDGAHWRCLNDAIWSEHGATQVTAWRLLHKVNAAWANETLDIAYLAPEVQAWAEVGMSAPDDGVIHRDSNGVILQGGDTVSLIKDLVVKGAGFTAKRGTAVRNISLVADNAGHIEGRVNGQHIVILCQFVKKSA
jgi:protein PhnA